MGMGSKSFPPFLEMNITNPADAQLIVAMREDGVEVDAILITDNPLFDPIKEW